MIAEHGEATRGAAITPSKPQTYAGLDLLSHAAVLQPQSGANSGPQIPVVESVSAGFSVDPGKGSSMGAAAMAVQGTRFTAATCSGVGFDVLPPRAADGHKQVCLASAGIPVPPDTSHWSTKRILLHLLDCFGTLSDVDLCRLDTLISKHERITMPRELCFAFKNGVNRRYILPPAAGAEDVGPRQLRRRRRHVREALEPTNSDGKADTSPPIKCLLILLQAAQNGETMAVLVPAQ